MGDEGQAERDVAFTRIISELEELYPDEPSRQSIRILNPGCGLGRLVMELVIRGFLDTRKRDQLPHAIGIKFYIESQPVSSQPFDISVFIEIVAFGKAKVSNKGHHNPRCGTVCGPLRIEGENSQYCIRRIDVNNCRLVS